MTDINDLPALVERAVESGLAAGEPRSIGDHGLAYVVPDGYRVETVDERGFEDRARHRRGEFKFVGVESLARYAARYKTDDTLAYICDTYGSGARMLTEDSKAVHVFFNDHPAGQTAHASMDVGHRDHIAILVLRPTAAARRWGTAFSTPLGQEAFLDLIVDGITEIADPAGAVLRDLVQDLHAIRSTEVKSVIRTGGQGAIEIGENVKLHAGQGNTVPFPELITIMFAPFAGLTDVITLAVTVKPNVARDGGVTFALRCPGLDDALAHVLGNLAGNIAESTDLIPHWVP